MAATVATLVEVGRSQSRVLEAAAVAVRAVAAAAARAERVAAVARAAVAPAANRAASKSLQTSA